MTREEFKQELDDRKYSYEEEGNKIIVNNIGIVDLDHLETLPEGIIFSNSDNVYLDSLKVLPEGIIFSNTGAVSLESLETLSNGIIFSNTGSVYLKDLKTIPYGFEFMDSTPYLDSIFGGFFSAWNGNIEGIGGNRLLNKMIKDKLFDRK